MTTYYTGNPLGSQDPRDLFDNAQNTDRAANSLVDEGWIDRFGVARKTWHGIEKKAELDTAQAVSVATALSEGYRDEAQGARDDAVAAASASGDFEFAKDLADMDAMLPLPDRKIIEVARDADHENARTRYVVASGVPVFVVNLDQLRLDLMSPSGSSLVLRQSMFGRAEEVAAKLFRYVDTEDAGCVRDGVADDYEPLRQFMFGGRGDVLAGTYNLGGKSLLVPNSIDIRIAHGVIFTNGYLEIRPVDAERRVRIQGDIYGGVDFSIRITGSYTAGENDPLIRDSKSVKLQCDDIVCFGKYPGASASILIYSIYESNVGNLYSGGSSLKDTAGAVDVDAKGIFLSDWWDSHVKNLTADGEYSMGVEIDHGTIRPAWSFCRCSIQDVFVRKPVAFPDFSGHHGFYFHGAYETRVGSVRGTGWGGNISSSADFKHRDCQGCIIETVNVGRARFTADNNYSWFSIKNQLNDIRNLTATTSISAVAAATGLNLNNRLGNVTTPMISFDNNNLGTRGFVFYGRCDIGGVSGVINCTSIAFDGGRYSIQGGAALRGTALFSKDAEWFDGVSFTPNTTTSLTKLQNVRVNGSLAVEPSSITSIHTLEYFGVFATGEIRAKRFGGVTSNAKWVNVTSGAAEPASTYQPTTKDFSAVAFNNQFYGRLAA